jgi:hypothetical protein
MAKKAKIDDTEDKAPTGDAALIAQAQTDLKYDQSAWNTIYEKARDDLRFLSDEKYAQWDEKDYEARVKTGRPALTIDQLSQFVHQVVNDAKQNTPAIEVIPSDDKATEATAEKIDGLIRNIQYKSNADVVFDTAITFSTKCSIGFMRVDHDYTNTDGAEQELLLKRVVNPLACWIDGDSIEIDGSDSERGTILDKMTVKAFKKKYPGKDPICFVAETTDIKKQSDGDQITIAEQFRLKKEPMTIAFDANGQKIENYQEGMPLAVPVRMTRVVEKVTVERFKMSGADILERTTFPGCYIPLVPVYGEEAWEDGERKLFSLIRKSKDAQKNFNMWKSLEMELLKKQPQAPVMASEGQTEKYREDWLQPDKTMVLRYRRFDEDGKDLGVPQRLEPPMIPTGIVNAARESVDDMKGTLGMYNASIGNRSNEVSGVAIAKRQMEGDVATYHYGDNLTHSVNHLGRVLVSALKDIYDTPRVERIIDGENQPQVIGINGKRVEGQEEDYNLTEGSYDVRVTTSAPYTTRRQEAAEFFTQIVTKMPDLMPIMGDLLFDNADFPGAKAMADRMRKVLDPKFKDPKDGEAEAPDPEKLQMQQVIEQGAQALDELQKQLDNKDAQSQLVQKKQALDAQEQSLKDAETIASLKIQLQKKDLVIAQKDAIKAVDDRQDAHDNAMLDDVLAAGSEIQGEQPGIG